MLLLPDRAVLGVLVLVSLKPPPSDWTDAIGAVADLFQNARVCFYRDSDDGTNDPITGTGSEPSIELIWTGMARVQQLRSAQEFATEYQTGANRSFRFQVSKNGDLPFLSSGVKARVLNAGVSGPAVSMSPGDDDLEKLVYVVLSSINASHYAVKTVETIATMRPIDWTWTVSDAGAVVQALPIAGP
jgi:hypothetical protein